jgi:hypothetical protein
LDGDWRYKLLSSLEDHDVAPCWRILESMRGIKQTQGGSIVAISKFLHFWNPRLFVIVDDAVMWKWVLRHHWVREGWKATRKRVETLMDIRVPIGESCDLVSYLAVLRWCAELMRINPEIMTCFTQHVRAYAECAAMSVTLESYEAVAIEWLLLGLVELPPAGVVRGSEERRSELGSVTLDFSDK